MLISLFVSGVDAQDAGAKPHGVHSTSPASQDVQATLSAGADAMRRGDYATAVDRFQTVTHMMPGFAEGYLNLGLAHEQSGDYIDAVPALDTARRLKPAVRGPNLFLGIAEYQLNALSKAEVALKQEVALDPASVKALMWLGVVETAEGRAEESIGPLDKAAALAPKDADVLYHRGRAHLLVSKASYQHMFAVDPDSYRVHEMLGQSDVEADRSSEAITEYKLAIDRAPRHPGLHEELGDLYWTSGETDLADAAYQQEVAIDPYSFPSNYKLGSMRVITGKAQAAISPLERAIQLDPSYPSAHYYMGRAQTDLGENEPAIANLKIAAAAPADPALNALALYQLQRVYRRLHRTEEATAALSQFQAMREQAFKEKMRGHGGEILDRRRLPKPELIPAETDAQTP